MVVQKYNLDAIFDLVYLLFTWTIFINYKH